MGQYIIIKCLVLIQCGLYNVFDLLTVLNKRRTNNIPAGIILNKKLKKKPKKCIINDNIQCDINIINIFILKITINTF